MLSEGRARTTPEPRVLAVAWVTLLLVSSLPDILWNEVVGGSSAWLYGAKLALLAALFLASFAWAPARALRSLFLLILILYLAEEVLSRLQNTSRWWDAFPVDGSFTEAMAGIQLARVGVALLMVLALFLVFRRRERFFLAVGDLRAPAAKEGVIIAEGTRWHRIGWVSAAAITSGTLAFLWLAGRPDPAQFADVVPLLPMVLLFAATNAFGEELSYRAVLLAPLVPVVGNRQAILMAATYFGIAHYYGVPYGVIGVGMSFVLGYLLSKAMVETRGFLWPWFIHFLQDVAIFSFMAPGTVSPGG